MEKALNSSKIRPYIGMEWMLVNYPVNYNFLFTRTEQKRNRKTLKMCVKFIIQNAIAKGKQTLS